MRRLQLVGTCRWGPHRVSWPQPLAGRCCIERIAQNASTEIRLQSAPRSAKKWRGERQDGTGNWTPITISRTSIDGYRNRNGDTKSDYRLSHPTRLSAFGHLCPPATWWYRSRRYQPCQRRQLDRWLHHRQQRSHRRRRCRCYRSRPARRRKRAATTTMRYAQIGKPARVRGRPIGASRPRAHTWWEETHPTDRGRRRRRVPGPRRR